MYSMLSQAEAYDSAFFANPGVVHLDLSKSGSFCFLSHVVVVSDGSSTGELYTMNDGVPNRFFRLLGYHRVHSSDSVNLV